VRAARVVKTTARAARAVVLHVVARLALARVDRAAEAVGNGVLAVSFRSAAVSDHALRTPR